MEKYRKLRNEIISLIRKPLENYFKQIPLLIDRNSPPGKLWSLVKSLTKLNKNRKPTTPNKSRSKLLLRPIEREEAINEYFTTVS